MPEAVERVGTYAEVSPSKTGVKIIGRGKIPEGLKNRTRKYEVRREIEVYDSGRYFTVTGEKLPEAPATVQNMPKEFEDFCRKFLDERNPAMSGRPTGVYGPGSTLSDDEAKGRVLDPNSERGDELRRMWEGEIPDKFAGDDSRADQSLVNAIVFYTGGDLDQADRVFRKSDLYREKWEREV